MQRLSGQEGGIAVIVAGTLVVLLGLSVLVLDVGNLYWERRQLQNGADAAALAAAQDIVTGNGGSAYETARRYADANNPRGAYVRPPSHGDPGFVVDTNSVTVTTRTGSYASEGTLNSILAGVLGFDRYANNASATASWGTSGSGTTIPLIMSLCEWNLLTNNLGPAALPTGVQTVYFHGTGPASANACGGPANQDYPGGFGWLDLDGGGTCTATVSMGLVPGSTGNSPPGPASGPCTYAYFSTLVGQEVLMPIHTEVVGGSGNNAVYTVVGFAAFEVTGYRFGGSQTAGAVPCSNPDRCIGGRFVNYYDLGGQPQGGGQDFGAYVIGLTG